ncbi:MAG: glycosyltransferase family 2 protein [Candidatus Pacearchaeota archaeon]|jgi:glycosyltransferase involved in cell wall biosynthesis
METKIQEKIKYERMKDKKISVIVPVYKAEKFIAKNLEEMKKSVAKVFPNNEIIVVIDGQLDNSMLESMKVSGIKVVGYDENKGKGYALKYGFEHSTGDYVTFIDCDLDIHPDQLRNFVPYMATADLVIGSKRHPFSKLHYPLSRKILSWGFLAYSWLILGVKLRDTQSGLKLIKREVLEIIMPLVLVKRYGFDLELCFLAQKHGFRTVEAPLHIDYNAFTDKDKKSTIKLKDIFGMFLDVLAIRYRYSFLNYYQRAFHKNMGWKNGDDYSDIELIQDLNKNPEKKKGFKFKLFSFWS